jgi:hypothetical protein
MAGLDPSPPGKPKAKYNGSAPASEDRARRRAGALRSWTEFGASALLAARAARLLDRFGFSWTIAVLPRTARKQGLDFLGFSLDSLVRTETFQWVTPDFWRKKISRTLLPLGRRRRDQGPVFLRCRNAVWLIEQAKSIFCFSAINCRRQKSGLSRIHSQSDVGLRAVWRNL